MTIRRLISRLALGLSVAMTAATGTALAGGNPNFTLPLHAKISPFELCDGYLPVDCLGVHSTVQVESGQQVTIFLLANNYSQLAGVQTAFDVDPSWAFSFGLWDCPPCLCENTPVPPFGPTYGTVIRPLDCVSSGQLITVGRMFFVAGSGCVGQVESSFPFGINALDCQQELDQIFPDEPGQAVRLGKVCVGPGGHDACEAATPVAAATWGKIKAAY